MRLLALLFLLPAVVHAQVVPGIVRDADYSSPPTSPPSDFTVLAVGTGVCTSVTDVAGTLTIEASGPDIENGCLVYQTFNTSTVQVYGRLGSVAGTAKETTRVDAIIANSVGATAASCRTRWRDDTDKTVGVIRAADGQGTSGGWFGTGTVPVYLGATFTDSTNLCYLYEYDTATAPADPTTDFIGVPQPHISFSVDAAQPVVVGFWVQSGHATNTATATITDYEVQETLDLANNPAGPPTGVSPANPNANTETVALLQQIYDFRNGTSRQVGSGHQIASYHSSGWTDKFQPGGDIYELKQLTSDIMPWMWGTDLDAWCESCNHDYTVMVANLTDHYSKGGIGMTNIHARCPGDQSQRWDAWECVDLNQLITPGTPEYNDWRNMLDEYAVGLQALEDNGVPIIIRPFHEMNRTKYWWSYNNSTFTAANFITLWQQTFDYYVTTKGLDNLLFVFGPTLGAGQSPSQTVTYWPGNDYVDIIAVSNYRGSTWDAGDQSDLDYYISFADTNDKQIAFAEGYANGTDEPNLFDNADVLTWLNANPEIAYAMFWDRNKAPYNYPNPDTVFNDSLIYNRPVN